MLIVNQSDGAKWVFLGGDLTVEEITGFLRSGQSLEHAVKHEAVGERAKSRLRAALASVSS